MSGVLYKSLPGKHCPINEDTDYRYRFVRAINNPDEANAYDLCNCSCEGYIGVAIYGGTKYGGAEIAYAGICQVYVDNPVFRGDIVTSTNSGKVTKHNNHNHEGRSLGVALENGLSGDLIKVRLY